MKRYKIHVGGRASEIKRVLSILFKRGYVFASNRIRTVESLEKLWGNERMKHWDWIVTGYDEECKAIIGVISGDTPICEPITIEEFLKLSV